MFFLAEFCDTVSIHPRYFCDKLVDSIERALNKKFANKVVHEVGLCIAVWEILTIGESFIKIGDGCTITKVTFRMVVFRPFADEILIGRVKSSSIEGVYISMGYFEDIFIPSDSLPTPNRFIETTQKWVWEYEMDDGAKHDLSIERGAQIRFKVVSEEFVEKTPPSGEKSSNAVSGAPVTPECDDRIPPYMILASIGDSGLGLLAWWGEG